jgi:hypothetical protein
MPVDVIFIEYYGPNGCCEQPSALTTTPTWLEVRVMANHQFTKVCRKCLLEKPSDQFGRHRAMKDGRSPWCRHCALVAHREWRQSAIGQASRRKSVYNLSHEQYLRLFASQDGKCAICFAEKPGGRCKDLLVDHCHKSGKVRGLLCHCCNVALGGFLDDPELLARAIAYLRRAAGTG